MGAYAHAPGPAMADTGLALLKKEVDAVLRPAAGRSAFSEPTRPAETFSQLIKQLIEPVGVPAPIFQGVSHARRSTVVPGGYSLMGRRCQKQVKARPSRRGTSPEAPPLTPLIVTRNALSPARRQGTRRASFA